MLSLDFLVFFFCLAADTKMPPILTEMAFTVREMNPSPNQIQPNLKQTPTKTILAAYKTTNLHRKPSPM